MPDQSGDLTVPSWIELMGRHAASSTQNLSALVTTVRNDHTTQWRVWHARGDRWRVEQDGQPVYLFDGRTAVTHIDGRMVRSRGDFHMPLFGSPGPQSFLGGSSLIDNLSRNIVPAPAQRGSQDGRTVFTVDITRDDQPQVVRVVFDADTGVLLRFGVDGVDSLRVEELHVLDEVPDDTFLWSGPVDDSPPPVDRDEMRRRSREIPWIAVLVQMVHGPNPPVRGVLRSIGEDGNPRRTVGWASIGGQPIPTIAGGVDATTLSVSKDGSRVRIEKPDGAPLLISNGTDCWRFRDDEIPTKAPASTVLFRGNGTELLTRRPASEWVGDDFTHPVGTVEMSERDGRGVYEFDLAPPAHMAHPQHMVVDAETGMVLSQSMTALGTVDEWSTFEVVDSLDDSLFTYSGPSESADERELRRHRAYDSARDHRLHWFRNNVTTEPLTARIEVSLTVTYVHELDEATGSFHANLDGHNHSGSLIRRVHSEEPWAHGLQDNARTWTSGGFDWALHLYGAELDDIAFEQLRRQIER